MKLTCPVCESDGSKCWYCCHGCSTEETARIWKDIWGLRSYGDSYSVVYRDDGWIVRRRKNDVDEKVCQYDIKERRRYLSKMELMKKMTSDLKRAMEDKRDEEILEMLK